MKEFGSDFHCIEHFFSQRASLGRLYPEAQYLANGRQCIELLILENHWERIWMPAYFCYEVIESIKKTGIEIVFYDDYPLADDKGIVSQIEFKEGDVLFRVNFFGLRDFRSNKHIPVPVIEDHTHDLLGHWALYSDADWCIASLRKSLPVAEGGMLWSPKGKKLPECCQTTENQLLADERWKAMEWKKDYLDGKEVCKETFRAIYLSTEEQLESIDYSRIDERGMKYVQQLDINAWSNAKRKNWKKLHMALSNKVDMLAPVDESCTSFSLVLKLKSKEERDRIRMSMIENRIYPAILWNVPEFQSDNVVDFSQTMISVHCDGRYSQDDIRVLADKLEQILQ